jgi:hypothetical protein
LNERYYSKRVKKFDSAMGLKAAELSPKAKGTRLLRQDGFGWSHLDVVLANVPLSVTETFPKLSNSDHWPTLTKAKIRFEKLKTRTTKRF